MGVFFINYLLYSVLNICCLCVRSLRVFVYLLCVLFANRVLLRRNGSARVDSVGGWVFFLVYFDLILFC